MSFSFKICDVNPCLLSVHLYHHFFIAGNIRTGSLELANTVETGSSLRLLVSSGKHTGGHLRAKLVLIAYFICLT